MPSKISTGLAARPTGWTRRDEQARDMRDIYWLASESRWLAKVPDGTNPDSGLIEYKRFKSNNVDAVIERRDKYVAGRTTDNAPRKVGREKLMTLGEWVVIYLANVKRGKATAKTHETYSDLLNGYVLPYLGAIPLQNLTQSRVERWLDEALADGKPLLSLNMALRYLKSCLEQAVATTRQAETGIRINVARSVKGHKDERKERGLRGYRTHPSETLRLVAACGDSYLASLPQVATDLGLRRSEIAALQWGDINLETGAVTLKRHVVSAGAGTHVTSITDGTKASKGASQTRYVSPESIAALKLTRDRLLAHKLAAGKAWRAGKEGTAGYLIPSNPVAPEAVVWPCRNGNMYQPNTLTLWFKGTLCKRAGITTKSIHSLRHDCATFLLNAGVPLTVVAHHMRHSDPSITAKIYAHLIEDADDQGAQAMSRIWQRAAAGQAGERAV